jgi:hypothetical protein
LGSAFSAGSSAYATHDFAADEWTRHHQGGTAGYLPREEIATASSTTVLATDQMLTWNPSIIGLKCEDTILTDTAGQTPRVLTHDPRWPTIEIHGMARPLVLDMS